MSWECESQKISSKRRALGTKYAATFAYYRPTFGAFGQYYQGSISDLGLLRTDDRGVHHVTEPGEAIARAFHQSIEDTPYIRKKDYLHPTVPWNDFAKSCHSFQIDGLAGSSKERDLLIDLFFREGFERKESPLRAYSLTSFLLLLQRYAEINGRGVEGTQWQLIYAPSYYRQLLLDNGRTREFQFPKQLEVCSEHWQMFCAHQFLTMALEYLLAAVLDLASEEVGGIGLSEICQRLTSDEFPQELSDLYGHSRFRPRDLMRHVGASSQLLDKETSLQNRRTFRLNSDLSEWRLLNLKAENPSRRTALALSVLAVLHAKWAGMNEGLAVSMQRESGDELTMWRVFRYLKDWFSEQATWKSVLEPIIAEFVITQHDRVMYGKGKLESCWLHMDKATGQIVKDQDYSAVYRSSRCDNSTSILMDLGLLQRNAEGNLIVTKPGTALLRKVLA